jgi:dTDP-4-dehydrorhamnose reductase
MKLLVIGANGQLGSDFMFYADALDYQAIGLTHADVDVTVRDEVFRVLRRLDFDVIINTAAYQGPRAYQDKDPTKFYQLNVFAPYYLAQFVGEHGKELVHFSTDFVFSGCASPPDGGFTEEHLPKPTHLYAASKLAGEAVIPQATHAYFVFRVASLYGASGCRAKNGSNFVKLVVERLSSGTPMRVVDDIRMSPTSTQSVVAKVVEVIRNKKYGLYHLAGSGSCSWHELAIEVARLKGLPVDLIERSSTQAVKQELERGGNTSLANRRLVAEGMEDLPNWQENLSHYLRERF